jgi:hypothetical protein
VRRSRRSAAAQPPLATSSAATATVHADPQASAECPLLSLEACLEAGSDASDLLSSMRLKSDLPSWC